MTTTTIFADGIIDVHIANGVARVTLGASTGQQEQRPAPSGMLIVPVMQLPVLARVFSEVTRQVEQRAKEALAQAQAMAQGGPAPEANGAAPPAEAPVTGAFRFNG
jgi:ABC-type phosphate transport system permease subunit